MSKSFYGSINLSQLLEEAKKGHTGFVKAGKNDHIFANITVWLNDEPDAYGNMLSIQVNQKKDDEQFKRFYIGNCKPNTPKEPEQLDDATVQQLPDEDDLPF